jgi:hypothetical protein
MLKARKSILAVLIALFVVAGFGSAFAEQIDGLTNGTVGAMTPPQGVLPSFTTGLDMFTNPGAIGDALLYNYYNAKGMITYFTVVNTDTVWGHRVRLRFREAEDVGTVCSLPQGSYEVLDFDICLSHGDMWGGYVTKSGDGGALCSWDTDTVIFDGTAAGVNFADTATFVGGRDSNGCVLFKFGSDTYAPAMTAAQTLEGHFEIIGEERLSTEPTTTECATVPASGIDTGNVLIGDAFLIDQASGATYAYNATAIANLANTGIAQGVLTSKPELMEAPETLDAVNYVLTKNRMTTIYDLIGAETEVIITFPSKLVTYQWYDAQARCPEVIWNDERVTLDVWNDAEASNSTTEGHGSPWVPTGEPFSLPYEVNVISVNTKSGSVTSNFISTGVGLDAGSDFDFGWLDFDLTWDAVDPANPVSPAHATTLCDDAGCTATKTSHGLPALGLMLLNIGNNASVHALPLQYSTWITSSAGATDGTTPSGVTDQMTNQ